MINMHYAFISILIVYLVATLFYLLRLIIGDPKLSAIALRITMVGAALQLGVLITHFVLGDQAIHLSYLEYFQFSALLLALVFIGLCFGKKFYGSGPFFIALIDIFCILSLTMDNPYLVGASARGSGYLSLHLSCIFLSLSVFSLALITAVMFLLSERQIRNKKFAGIVAKFPSLATLDDIHYKALYVGFILFTLAIITGAGYSKVMTGQYISNDPKQILSFLSWCFFAIFLNFRVKQGWQGHKGILLSFVGFASMILLFIVGLT